MSADASHDFNNLASNPQFKDATKGTGLTQTRNGLVTPPSKAEFDVERIEAGTARQQEASVETTPVEPVTTRHQPPEPDDDDSDAATKNVIEILKCTEDEHRKILGVKERYDHPKEEEEAILDGLWDRGKATHPKFNGTKGAGEAFGSKYTSS